jgi:hypothetical protein
MTTLFLLIIVIAIILQLPAKKFAAIKFSWPRTNNRIEKMETKLLKLLSRDNVKV